MTYPPSSDPNDKEPSTMYSPHKSLASTYHQVHVETSAAAADPHKLIDMLLEGALDAIAKAAGAMDRKDIATKSNHISRAIRIIEEGLRSSLDKTSGGKVAQDLDVLYQYLVKRLTLANLRNDLTALAECTKLLQPVREAWQSIRPSVGSGRPQ
jgi:flagellar protein FliS